MALRDQVSSASGSLTQDVQVHDFFPVRDDVRDAVSSHESNAEKTVMCFGTFDVLHPGHIAYLREAVSYGSRLVVIVARDATVLRIKGKVPLHTEEQRLRAVAARESIAVLGGVDDPYEVLSLFHPAVLCLGYDQRGFADGLAEALRERKLSPRVVRASAFHPERYKSSRMRLA
ncbi:FAD synthase [Candidatus Woesearchaeota archaeon CG_4_10_14_0_2_um_filter_57_5]|nr:MAG: FAD synthase [Candidatus Woesearchaeota archaeon CG_4_10_14_0_2_um_filter_57_5]